MSALPTPYGVGLRRTSCQLDGLGFPVSLLLLQGLCFPLDTISEIPMQWMSYSVSGGLTILFPTNIQNHRNFSERNNHLKFDFSDSRRYNCEKNENSRFLKREEPEQTKTTTKRGK